MVPTPEGGPKKNRRPRPTARGPTVNGAGERATWPGSAGHCRDSKGSATPVASTAIGCVIVFETNLPHMLTSLPPLYPPPRPFCSFGWEQRGACCDGPPVNGLANSIAQGQAQRDVEMDCYGGPVSKVSGPPETTESLARGGPPLQVRHQRRLQPSRGTLSPPTGVISDSAFEEWLQLNEMEMPMFSLSKGQRQQPPNSAASVGWAPASSAVAGASTETSAAEPATSGTVPSAASIRGAVNARESSAGAV